MGEKINAFTICAGICEGKRPHGRPGHRWVETLTCILKKRDWRV
jgi:hypothetical protein